MHLKVMVLTYPSLMKENLIPSPQNALTITILLLRPKWDVRKIRKQNSMALRNLSIFSIYFLHIFCPPQNDTFWHLQKNENKNHKIVITLEVTSISSNIVTKNHIYFTSYLCHEWIFDSKTSRKIFLEKHICGWFTGWKTEFCRYCFSLTAMVCIEILSGDSSNLYLTIF